MLAIKEYSHSIAEGDNLSAGEYYTTIEEQVLFSQCYPHLAQTFTDMMASKKKPARSTRKKKGKNRTFEVKYEELGIQTFLIWSDSLDELSILFVY